MQKILIIPDSHLPFHHKRNFALMIKAAKAFKPDIKLVLGDMFDFNATSQHRKKPQSERNSMTLEQELKKGRAAFQAVEGIKTKRSVYICGNHEENFERYVADNCKVLWDTLPDIPELLGLSEGWEFVPYRDYIRIGRVNYTHDVDGKSGAGAMRSVLKAEAHNIVHGHTHRMQYEVLGCEFGQPHVGASFGWLGDPKKVKYMHRISRNREWAAGFGIGYIEPNGTTHLQPVPIVGNRCLIEGRVITL